MKVCHVTGSVSSLGGGIALALRSLANGQKEQGIDPLVFAPEDRGEPLGDWPPGLPTTLPARRIGPILWGRDLLGRLETSKPDLVHTHGLWGQPSIVANRLHAPVPKRVVSPHGMLDAWALQNGRFRKKLAMILFERRFLESVDCLHALCRSEAESIRSLGLRNPVAVIPNGVDLPICVTGRESKRNCKTLLFLGRLHPKKGLPNALRAFAELNPGSGRKAPSGSWRLVVVGWNQGGHQEELETMCRELGLTFGNVSVEKLLAAGSSAENGETSKGKDLQVVFTGPAFGEEKDRLFQQADAFILPSFSEGLPVAVLEAWSYQLPVLMTGHCNLPEGFAAKAAIPIGTDVPSIAEGMRELFASSPSALGKLGSNGRSLVERQFTWPQVAEQMKLVYEWLVKGGNAPECVENSGGG